MTVDNFSVTMRARSITHASKIGRHVYKLQDQSRTGRQSSSEQSQIPVGKKGQETTSSLRKEQRNLTVNCASLRTTESGEGGIRTPGRAFTRRRFSRPVHSATLPPLRCSADRACAKIKVTDTLQVSSTGDMRSEPAKIPATSAE